MSSSPSPTSAAKDSPKVLPCGSPCTALAFSSAADPPFLLVGSEDGALRSYAFPFDKVHRAVKTLGQEISCITYNRVNDAGREESCWVACGRDVSGLLVSQSNYVLKRKSAGAGV